ncbi:MAG: GIY-YIG nuclease family protein [Ruminococcus sp.]|nr:GIY-YIG nuclease family protein [Ruminococcus sp.]
MIGIYKITNILNQKVYIGQSVDIEKRWAEHIRCANNSDKPNTIYQAIRKYGVENFTFEVIEECSQEKLNEREIYWIDYYNSYYDGYNMTLGGDNGYLFDYNFLVEQYKIYKTTEETAKHCGCQPHTVSKALKAFNIVPNADSLGTKRPIKQIDPTTLKTIATYPSLAEAVKAIGEKNTSAISRVLAGKGQTAYGYIWKDIDFDETTLTPIHKTKEDHSQQLLEEYDLQTNERINIFNSVKDACLFYNKNPKNSCIYRVCRGERKSWNGSGWRFINKEVNK